MNTRQLHYIIVVAEEKSFSTAARKLFIAQPSLSQFVGKVEEELGYKLFDRATTPLKLTAEGKVYIETARKILILVQEMESRLSDMNETRSGKLAVGVSPYNGILTLVLKQFFDVFPNYKVYIQDSVGTEERLRLLEIGELDLCVQPISAACDLSSKFVVDEIMMDGLLLAVPLEYPINNELICQNDYSLPYPSVDLSMLRDVPFVIVQDNKRLRKRISNLFEQVGIEPRTQVICSKSEGCLAMASAGIGATIVQSSLIKYGELQPKVKYYSILQDNTKEKIAAISIRNRYISKAAQAFIDILKTV
jgi:DNA-binding transcriptional LysR family regulator